MNSTLKKSIDFYLDPVETPLVMGCLFLGGLAVMTVGWFFYVPIEGLMAAFLVYVITSPLWIYKIKTMHWGKALTTAFHKYQRWMAACLRRAHIM